MTVSGGKWELIAYTYNRSSLKVAYKTNINIKYIYFMFAYKKNKIILYLFKDTRE